MRSMSMKNFRGSGEAKKHVITTETAVVLGQVLGYVSDVQTRMSKLPDGTEKPSLVCFGEFEGVNYEMQSKGRHATPPDPKAGLMQAEAIYLPGYYAEAVQARLKTNGGKPISFAIEIVMVPTGANIPIAYDVRSLIEREPSNPIEQMKRKLMRTNPDALRLPPPVEATDDDLPKIADGTAVAHDYRVQHGVAPGRVKSITEPAHDPETGELDAPEPLDEPPATVTSSAPVTPAKGRKAA